MNTETALLRILIVTFLSLILSLCCFIIVRMAGHPMTQTPMPTNEPKITDVTIGKENIKELKAPTIIPTHAPIPMGRSKIKLKIMPKPNLLVVWLTRVTSGTGSVI